MIKDIEQILGSEAESLLTHRCNTVPKEMLHLPGPDFIDRVVVGTDRRPQVLRNLGALFNHGRLAGTGYVSILPVDQGIEHSAGASFAPNPEYFDPENLVKLAIEDGCAAHFRDTTLAEVVTSRPEARAYQVERASEGGDATETPLTARLLS